MSIPGYAGSILFVDLTSGKNRVEPLDPGLPEELIGGWGINNRLIYDLMPGGVEPLSPENLIIIGAGPFAGTIIPGAAEVLATTRYPLNGAFASAAGGGSFALMLKSTGYDHVVISGRAENPVYLKIADDDVEICDASELWGRDGFETIDYLRKRHEPCSVIPIGQAGENLVKISITSVDKAGTLGRGGLAAVMGSKKLKAIVVQKGRVETKIAKQLVLQKIVNTMLERIMKWPGRQMLLDNGMTPLPPDIAELYRKTKQTIACPSCPLADKQVVELNEGPYAGLRTAMPHLIIRGFETRNSQEAFEQSIKYADTLDRYGLCSQNFSNLLSLVVKLYQEGVINKGDTGGIEIRNDIGTALKLAQMTANREGLGEVMADGLVGIAQKIGRVAGQYVEHIKGQSIINDPRLHRLGTMEFEQLTSLRGAHVAAGGSPSWTQGRPPGDFTRHGERMGISGEALKRVVDENSFNPGRYSRYSEDWFSLFNCLSLCNRAQINRFYHVNTITELYSAVTGIDTTPANMMKNSERAWTIGKMLNVREGFNRKDDTAPDSWFKPLTQDGKECHLTDYYETKTLTRNDMDGFLDDYYDERGYDKQNGIPTKAKLKELGLEKMFISE
ncbi:aldehyde ferredoxin oxidoreductase N-terminal domain-containing protein [Chloroflexota bacterium]